MLIHSRPMAALGHIAFEFERLPVSLNDDQTVWGQCYGTAHIGYDGHGSWWVAQIALSSPREPGPSKFLPVCAALFAEIRERLDQYRADDIDGRIATALRAGQHMAIFDEHRPNDPGRRPGPPHARRTPSRGFAGAQTLAIGAGAQP